MKNKNGFTLVELLAVIVVLAIIITIAVPSAISISNKIKAKMEDTKRQMIVDAAKLYGQENPSSVVNSIDNCSNSKITVGTLVNDGYIKKDDVKNGEEAVVNPKDNSSMNNLKICIYKKNNRVYSKIME